MSEVSEKNRELELQRMIAFWELRSRIIGQLEAHLEYTPVILSTKALIEEIQLIKTKDFNIKL